MHENDVLVMSRMVVPSVIPGLLTHIHGVRLVVECDARLILGVSCADFWKMFTSCVTNQSMRVRNSSAF